MAHRAPLISFITPSFHGHARLGQAIASLQAQTDGRWEMIISPDDGEDYSQFAGEDTRIRIVPTRICRSGPGAARNRGLALANGEHIAYLDDDDTVASNYVETVLQALAATTTGFVLTPTTYVSKEGNLMREIGTSQGRISIADFAVEYGSLHAIGRRQIYPRWHDCFAQDVLHTCEAIDRAGGSLPVVQNTRYQATVREDNVSTTRKDIDAEYARIIDSQLSELTPAGTQQTLELFRLRRKVNAAFNAQKSVYPEYHGFVQSLLHPA